MFVKICGLVEPVTLAAAVRSGADAVGFVFAPGSPRTVDPQTVRDLLRLVPDTVETVGVFRKQAIDEVLEIARAAGVCTVQMHGGEPLEDLERVRAAGFDVIRALSGAEYLSEMDRQPEDISLHRLLLDAPVPGAGVPFDLQPLLGRRPPRDWLLAGGLNPSNVASLIEQARPGGVDVSSGVENSRGVKDVELIERFIAAARP